MTEEKMGALVRLAGGVLKWMFTSRTGQLLTAAGTGAVAAKELPGIVSVNNNKPAEENSWSIGGWLSKLFMKHGLGFDVDKFDWKQGAGMLVVGTAIAGLSRHILGDNIVSTVASLALGIAVAAGMRGHIKSMTDGMTNYFNSFSAPQKPQAQAQSHAPAPAP